jgi:CRP/FNR family cyclic AMP-dependent transcriptional regulator
MNTNDVNYKYCFNKLQENPLFENLDKETMGSLMECFSLKKWKKNTAFFHGDKTFYNFYIIVSGRLKMYQIDAENGKEFTVLLLTENDVF